MSDFATMMELAARYSGLLDKLVPLAEQVAPEIMAAEPAVKEIVDLLFGHRDSQPTA